MFQKWGALNLCTESFPTFLPEEMLTIPVYLPCVANVWFSCLVPIGSSKSSVRMTADSQREGPQGTADLCEVAQDNPGRDVRVDSRSPLVSPC